MRRLMITIAVLTATGVFLGLAMATGIVPVPGTKPRPRG